MIGSQFLVARIRETRTEIGQVENEVLAKTKQKAGLEARIATLEELLAHLRLTGEIPVVDLKG